MISPNLIQSVIDDLDVMLVILDPALTVLACNQSAVETLIKGGEANPPQSLVGQALPSIIADEAAFEKLSPLIMELLSGQRPSYSEQLSFQGPQGSNFIKAEGFPLIDRESNSIVGVTLAFTDLFYEKQLEAQLLQTEELFTFKEVLLGAANELNNLLTIIATYTVLMTSRSDMAANLVEELNRISEQTHRAKAIVSNLLTLAKKHDYNKVQRIDLNAIIQKTFEMRQYELTVNNMLMEFDLQELPFTVGDPDRIQQLVLNLINHCMESIIATGLTGTITLKTYVNEEGIHMDVSDNGPQFAEADLSNVFNPFYTHTGERKIGMGISICRRIVSEHGGEIVVANNYPRGGTFNTRLPVVDPSDVNIDDGAPVNVSAHANRVEGARSKYKKIMVVDDEEGIRTVLQQLLEALGYQAIVSGDGRVALSQIIKDQPDAIISDMRMPNVNGKTLFKAIQKINPKLAANMMFITGDVVRTDSSGFLKEYNLPYLNKPFTLEDLEIALDHLATTEAERLNKAVV
ncbi:MAG: ATP-binding protein [Verrucomicrobiae bacterium]|nr:ATP-binding protein [Verrucomicrobiae bacterium]